MCTFNISDSQIVYPVDPTNIMDALHPSLVHNLDNINRNRKKIMVTYNQKVVYINTITVKKLELFQHDASLSYMKFGPLSERDRLWFAEKITIASYQAESPFFIPQTAKKQHYMQKPVYFTSIVYVPWLCSLPTIAWHASPQTFLGCI